MELLGVRGEGLEAEVDPRGERGERTGPRGAELAEREGVEIISEGVESALEDGKSAVEVLCRLLGESVTEIVRLHAISVGLQRGRDIQLTADIEGWREVREEARSGTFLLAVSWVPPGLLGTRMTNIGLGSVRGLTLNHLAGEV